MVQDKEPDKALLIFPSSADGFRLWVSTKEAQQISKCLLIQLPQAMTYSGKYTHKHYHLPACMSEESAHCPDEGTRVPILHPASAPPRYITPMTGVGIGCRQWGPQTGTIRVSVPADIHTGCRSSWQVASLGCFVVGSLG